MRVRVHACGLHAQTRTHVSLNHAYMHPMHLLVCMRIPASASFGLQAGAYLHSFKSTVDGTLTSGLAAAVWQQLQLRASVGVARNKTVAKLASAAAKPDGVHIALSQGEVLALLKQVPAKRLPQAGGRDAQAFAKAGIDSVADLQVRKAAAADHDVTYNLAMRSVVGQ